MRLGEVDRFLVSQRDARALAYFVNRLFVAHGLRERMLWGFLRATDPRLASALLVERSWTFRPATLSLDPAGGPPVSREQADRWRTAAGLLEAVAGGVRSEEDGELGRPEEWDRAILLRDYDGSRRRRLVVFPFEGGERRPSAVLKLRHRGGTEPPLEVEWEALRRLDACLPPALAETVPAPLGYAATPETELLLMSHLPGTSAYVQTQNDLRPRRWVTRHFRAAGEWLADFHLATRVSGRCVVPGPEELEPVDPGGSAGGGKRAAWLLELSRLLRRHPVAPSAGHGDFWSRNLLLEDPSAGGALPERIRIVDWEHFETRAPPWRDLIHFAVAYGTNYPWSRYRRAPVPEAFRRTFLEENHVSRQVRRYFDRYAARTGLARSLLEPLLRLYLLRRARATSGKARRSWLACERRLAAAPRTVLPSGR